MSAIDDNAYTLHMAVVVPSNADSDEQAQLAYATRMKANVLAARRGMLIDNVTAKITHEVQVKDSDDKFLWREADVAALGKMTIPDNAEYRDVWYFTFPCVESPVIAVLADTVDAATEYAKLVWPETDARLIAVTDRVSLSRLYGHQGTPFVVAPNTTAMIWHRDINYHVVCGRIIQFDPDSE